MTPAAATTRDDVTRALARERARETHWGDTRALARAAILETIAKERARETDRGGGDRYIRAFVIGYLISVVRVPEPDHVIADRVRGVEDAFREAGWPSA